MGNKNWGVEEKRKAKDKMGRAYAEAGEQKGEDLVKGKGQEGVPDLADKTWCLKEHKGGGGGEGGEGEWRGGK